MSTLRERLISEADFAIWWSRTIDEVTMQRTKTMGNSCWQSDMKQLYSDEELDEWYARYLVEKEE